MSDSEESLPPAVAPRVHPVFEQGHGRGRGRGRGRGPPSAAGSDVALGCRLMPISMIELEIRHRASGDGAESALFTEDEEEEGVPRAKPSRKRKRADPSNLVASAALGGEEDEDV